MRSCKTIANKLDITCSIFSYPDGTKLLAKIQSADSSSFIRGNVRSTCLKNSVRRQSTFIHQVQASCKFYVKLKPTHYLNVLQLRCLFINNVEGF